MSRGPSVNQIAILSLLKSSGSATTGEVASALYTGRFADFRAWRALVSLKLRGLVSRTVRRCRCGECSGAAVSHWWCR